MNRTGKIILFSTLGLGIAVGGCFLARNIRNRRAFGQTDGFFKNNKKGNTDVVGGDNSIVAGQNLVDDLNNSQFDPHPFAERIYMSMKGAGTDENAFFGVYDELNANQRKIVNKYFDEFDIGKGSSLREWVDGDFGSWYDSSTNYEKAKLLIEY